MSLKKFEKSDVFKNVIKAKPRFEIKLYRGKEYINNSLNNFISINNANLIGAVQEEQPPEPISNGFFDFSDENNSYNLALI